MKRLLILAAVATLGAGVAVAAISGSDHDLSAGYGGTGGSSNDETCVFCHTPHNAAIDVPLWNNGLGTGTYDVYTSGTMDAASGNWTGGAGNGSDLCMGCHDGVDTMGDVGNHGTGTVTDTGAMTAAAAIVGTDLTNDHPVNIDYTADGEMTAIGSLNSAIALDANDYVQCYSCHDVHNAGAAGKYLVISNDSSALCTACHTK